MTDKKCNPIEDTHSFSDSDYFDVVTAPQVAILFIGYNTII